MKRLIKKAGSEIENKIEFEREELEAEIGKFTIEPIDSYNAVIINESGDRYKASVDGYADSRLRIKEEGYDGI